MAIFFEKNINPYTRLAIWKIEEPEIFFKAKVPVHRHVTHPHKRLQHLAGRFLLQYLFPAFPMQVIQVADTRQPFLSNQAYHFSISHCGDYAAAVASTRYRTGVDIELPSDKISRIRHKFLSDAEYALVQPAPAETLARCWSAKEAVYKWYSRGAINFKKDMVIRSYENDTGLMGIDFKSGLAALKVQTHFLTELALAYVV